MKRNSARPSRSLTACLLLITSVGMIFPGLADAAGKYLQYSFAYTSGSVQSRGGGRVVNECVPFHSAYPLRGNGGTYSPDIPGPGRARFSSGKGSLILSTGSLAARMDDSPEKKAQFLGFPEVMGNEGFTMEVWVKGGGPDGMIMTSSGVFALESTSNGLRWVSGFQQLDHVKADFDKKEWHHVACILEIPQQAGQELVGNLVLYVDGEFKGRRKGARFLKDHQLAFCLGDHPRGNINQAWTGQIYEPRVSLGVLTPDEFMCFPPAKPGSAQAGVATAASTSLSGAEAADGMAGGGRSAVALAWIMSAVALLSAAAAWHAFRTRKIALQELRQALSRLESIRRGE